MHAKINPVGVTYLNFAINSVSDFFRSMDGNYVENT